jgi:Cu(I)/Ag(I) efflux system membrane fusion protein/cobalt-zinc-cadmium efflux system membrane fusion protein
METKARRVALILLVAAAVVVVAAGYVFRGRLAALPLVSRLMPSTSVGAAATPGAAATDGAPVAPSVSTADARAEIIIEPQRQQLIGVRLAPVQRTQVAPVIRTTGVVRYDETRLTDVNVKLDGWIRDLRVDYTGQFVRQGQPLFTFYSPDLLATQNEYLLALKTRDQLKGSQVADAREYADRLVDAARQRIVLWDLPTEQIRALEETRQPQTTVTFTSPATGYVIEKQALQGMHVRPGQMLYKIADLSVVWVEADIYEQEIGLVRVGQRATVTLDAYPGQATTGRSVYIYPYVEENTRTVKVRFSFANSGGRLKPGMYASVELRGPAVAGLTVPTNAVLDSGTRQTVFVARAEGYFTPRTVKIGRRLGDSIEITEGVKEGEQVATSAAFFLDSESQLRAGLQSYEAPPAATPPSGGAPAERLDITFRPQPDPPQTGDSMFEVTVKDPAGQPITDAEVSVVLFMPAMPTMNMPAMRNETKLSHAGEGVYRGAGQVMMRGRWDVTVNVNRAGQRVATKQFAMAAR